MDITFECRLAGALAERLREGRETLARRWMERIVVRLEVEPERVFPHGVLLDRVPLLMERIADHLHDPGDGGGADAPLIAIAIELGELRHAQGFDVRQILREYEVLGGVLFTFVGEALAEVEPSSPPEELLACTYRLFRAVSVIQRYTTDRFVSLAAERVREREDRLRSFNRMVSHELKNRIGAVLGAGQLLSDPAIADDPERRGRFAGMVMQNAEAMHEVLHNLMELSRMEADARHRRDLPLRGVVGEVCRQLSDMAQSERVEVVVEALPEVSVSAPALELCLANYLSNAIKYSDPAREERWVRIHGRVEEAAAGRRLVIAVEDNGIGVPEEMRRRLFSRFYRAHGVGTGKEGTGLGLSIVRDTVESLGGSAWAEFEGVEGSRFLLSVPLRREADREAGAV